MVTREEFKKVATEILKGVRYTDQLRWSAREDGAKGCLLERAAEKLGTSWHFLKEAMGGPLTEFEVAALYGMNDEGHLERLRHLVDLL
jgi:hypothetical protein